MSEWKSHMDKIKTEENIIHKPPDYDFIRNDLFTFDIYM